MGGALRRTCVRSGSANLRRFPARAHDSAHNALHPRRPSCRGNAELSAAPPAFLASASAACPHTNRCLRHAAGCIGKRLPKRGREGRVPHALLPQSHAYAHTGGQKKGTCGSMPTTRCHHHRRRRICSCSERTDDSPSGRACPGKNLFYCRHKRNSRRRSE